MVIAFFLFETFKEDVLEEVIPITSYASTVRRNIIDIACKIVKDRPWNYPKNIASSHEHLQN